MLPHSLASGALGGRDALWGLLCLDPRTLNFAAQATEVKTESGVQTKAQNGPKARPNLLRT